MTLKYKILQILSTEDSLDNKSEKIINEFIEEVRSYSKKLEEYFEDVVGTTHEDNLMMLTYDASSRQIALRHLLNTLSKSEDL